jgi:hypothetical protein
MISCSLLSVMPKAAKSKIAELTDEAVPKIQFWGDKLCLSSNLRFNRKSWLETIFSRASSIANKFCALTEFWNWLRYERLFHDLMEDMLRIHIKPRPSTSTAGG